MTVWIQAEYQHTGTGTGDLRKDLKEESAGLFANLENLSESENVAAMMKYETEQEEQEVERDIVQEECLLLRSPMTPAAIRCTKPWGFGRETEADC